VAAAVAFFNNKGGVGKTTLACNYAAYAAGQGARVVIIDLDPQCNSTQLVLDDAQWDEIYEDRRASEPKTVMGLLRHFRGGEARLDMDAWRPVHGERFGIDVLPGHPSLSILEDLLSEAWSSLKAGQAAGARRSLWLRALREEVESEYDLVIVDVSPSLGAINRSALVGCDAFVTPMAPDLFSLYALENITGWFERWLREYDGGRSGAQGELEDINYGLKLPDPLPIRHGYVGYTVQQYVSRSSGGEVRQTEAYEQHRREIPKRAKSLRRLSRLNGNADLGTVPNMFSMIPLAQSCHAPIAGLRKEDGLRGAQISQQQRYVEQLEVVFDNIAARVAATTGE